MITHKQFVKSLGEHAKKYTPGELQQLHIDVRKMARILIAVWREQQRTVTGTENRKGDTFMDDPE